MAAQDVLLWVGAGLGAVVVATLSRVLSEDAKTFIPRFAERLIQKSADRIHEDEADAFCEEWLAHLRECQELTGKLSHALSIRFWGAGRVCRLVGHSSKRSKSFWLAKRALDVSFVLIPLPLVGAICISIAAITVLSGAGNPFYGQERVGRKGKRIRIWKFRTMVRNPDQVLEEYLRKSPAAKSEWEMLGKLKDDPRITNFGRFLQKSSLNELPQLWNVLIGDLSLVGPRPYLPGQEPTDLSSKYYDLTPGLTGLWQISDRNGKTPADRTRADEEYYKRQSLLTDLRILFETVGVGIKSTGR
jgi:exopolysaccharide production protein ExoY